MFAKRRGDVLFCSEVHFIYICACVKRRAFNPRPSPSRKTMQAVQEYKKIADWSEKPSRKFIFQTIILVKNHA
jgi:hypothetical protein